MLEDGIEYVEVKVKVPKRLREYVLAMLQLREFENEDECWTQFIIDGAEAQISNCFLSGEAIKKNFKLNEIFKGRPDLQKEQNEEEV